MPSGNQIPNLHPALCQCPRCILERNPSVHGIGGHAGLPERLAWLERRVNALESARLVSGWCSSEVGSGRPHPDASPPGVVAAWDRGYRAGVEDARRGRM